jgi:hypothetical protein
MYAKHDLIPPSNMIEEHTYSTRNNIMLFSYVQKWLG